MSRGMRGAALGATAADGGADRDAGRLDAGGRARPDDQGDGEPRVGRSPHALRLPLPRPGGHRDLRLGGPARHALGERAPGRRMRVARVRHAAQGAEGLAGEARHRARRGEPRRLVRRPVARHGGADRGAALQPDPGPRVSDNWWWRRARSRASASGSSRPPRPRPPAPSPGDVPTFGGLISATTCPAPDTTGPAAAQQLHAGLDGGHRPGHAELADRLRHLRGHHARRRELRAAVVHHGSRRDVVRDPGPGAHRAAVLRGAGAQRRGARGRQHRRARRASSSARCTHRSGQMERGDDVRVADGPWVVGPPVTP